MTVLGSCVAVCLWDKLRGIGGMNHFVLPNDRKRREKVHVTVTWQSTQKLEAGLMRLGCRTSDLQAKVFGGAAVVLPVGGQTVGQNNVQLALESIAVATISGSLRNLPAARLASRSGFIPGPGAPGRYIIARPRKIIPPDPRDLASGGEFVAE